MASVDSVPLKVVRGIAWAALAIGVAFALFYGILYITKGRFLKSFFERHASTYAHREVKVAGDFQLYLNPRIKFVAEGLTVSNPAWAADRRLVDARKVDLELRVLPLVFSGKRRMPYLFLDGANFGLERDGRGRNTWTLDPNDPKPLTIPEVARAEIAGTRLTYRDQPNALVLRLAVDPVRAAGNRVENAVRLSGDGSARGVPIKLSGRIDNPNAALASQATRAALTLVAAESTIDVAGTLPGPTVIEGAELKVHARGKNIAGPFTLLGTTVPPTRRYDLRSNLTKDGADWKFTRLTGTFGDSDLAGQMTVRYDKRLTIAADLHSRVLDVLDAGPWFGYDPAALDAKGAKGFVQTIGGRPRVLPDAPLAYDSLGRMDADVRYKADRVHAGKAPIRNFIANVKLDNRLLKLQPLAIDLAGGRLSANVEMNARRRPVVTDFDIRQSPVGIDTLLTAVGVSGGGTTGTISGRVQLRGTGDSVHKALASSDGRIAVVVPKGTLWVRNDALVKLDVQNYVAGLISNRLRKPVEINCGLIAFTVRGGRAVADPIVFDTTRSVVNGRGSFSFADESLDLAIRGDSKRVSLFSGQSPIGIKGYFATPGIRPISKQLVARAGAAVGLGLLTGGPGAILAFIDPGDAKAQACAPILAAKPAAAQVKLKRKGLLQRVFG